MTIIGYGALALALVISIYTAAAIPDVCSGA